MLVAGIKYLLLILVVTTIYYLYSILNRNIFLIIFQWALALSEDVRFY